MFVRCYFLIQNLIRTKSPQIMILQWRHNERDGASNHHPHDCLPNRLFRHRSKKTSKLRITGLWWGIHRWPVNSPHKGPAKRIFIFIFDDVIMMYQVWWEFILLNSLWPNDTIWEHRSGTTLVRVMVYYLTKFIHNALIKWTYLQPDICVSRLKACHPWWSWGEYCIFCYIKPVKRLRKIYIYIYIYTDGIYICICNTIYLCTCLYFRYCNDRYTVRNRTTFDQDPLWKRKQKKRLWYT